MPYVLHDGGFKNIRTPHFKVHLLRGFFSVGGSLCFMYGLQFVKLLDATVLQNFEQVILVVVGIVFFHEKMSNTKIVCIIMSVIGVLIIMNPNILYMSDVKLTSMKINHGYFFILLATIFWVCNNVVIKKLGQKSTNKAQLFYLMLFSSIFAYPVAFLEWNSFSLLGVSILLPSDFVSIFDIGISITNIKFILFMSLCYLIHSVSLFNAFKFGEFSVVMPFVYFKLVWAGIFGYVLFSSTPQYTSWIGYLLITIAGFLLMKREIRRRRNRINDSVS
ncbi:MAG: DMT family transporter [Alphaproteobacteria bacterium]|nr:DMT family transporter [Alphaproteobacteria bacterium]